MVNPVRLDPDDDGPIPGEWDPEHWWTFGEAADLAGVAHRELAEWAGAGRLTIRTGWREGAEIRLVRAGDVARLAPCVIERASRPRAGLGERAVFTGPRRSALGNGAPTAPARRTTAPIEGPIEGPAEAPADAEEFGWGKELEREVDRVREELDDMRSHRDELLTELVALRPDSGRGEKKIIEDDRLRIVHGANGPSGPLLHRMRGTLRPVLVAVALFTGVVLGRRSVAGDERVVEASVPVAATSMEEVLEVPSGAPTVSTPGPLLARPGGVLAGSPARIESAFTAHEVSAEPDVEPIRVSSLRLTLPCRLLEIDRALQVAATGVPACALDLLVRGDPDVRRALGPCSGPLTADGSAVAGRHRIEGTAWCSQHAFVERVASGASNAERRAALLAEAAQAEREGLVPPLLALRAERSAASFLRAGVGTWSTSGFDGSYNTSAPGEVHEWTLRESAREAETLTLELTSWVCITPDDAPRSFHLVLDVAGAPTGDVLRSFDWLGR